MASMTVLEGGTDAASMVLFDPQSLPDDFDHRSRSDPIGLIEQLAAEGRLCWLDPSADGGYSLGVCVESGLPKELIGYARPLAIIERFAIPGGRLHFAGIEYAHRHDDAMLKRYPQMGSSCEVVPGTYRLAVFEMDYPEDLDRRMLRAALPPAQFRLYEAVQWLTPLGCVSVAVVGALLVVARRIGGLLALLGSVALLVVAFGLSRTDAYREAHRLYREIQRRHPCYIATLARIDTDPDSHG